MLVDPRRISARRMDHAKERIYPNEVPRIYRGATVLGIALQLLRVNRGNAALGQTRSRRAAVQLGIVKVNALVIVGRGSGRCRVGSARSASQAGARCLFRSIERPVIGYVVVKAGRFGRAAGSQRRHSREGVGGFRRLGVHIIDARLAQRCHVRAVLIPTVHSRNPV